MMPGHGISLGTAMASVEPAFLVLVVPGGLIQRPLPGPSCALPIECSADRGSPGRSLDLCTELCTVGGLGVAASWG